MTEAYRAMRDFTFNGRHISAGDRVERAWIVGVAPEKEGTLLRTRFIEAVGFTGDDLGRKSKPELVEFARTLGATVDPNWRKADLIEAIRGEL